MQLSRIENEELFDLKKSEVPEKNEELIGLNYNQFIKSVLLAQGEFAQFLKAKKEDRGELLEKITGTGIYRQLGRMAWEKHKEVSVEILQQQQAISLLRPKLLEPEKKDTVSASLAEKESMCKPLEEAREKLKKQLELKEALVKREAEIAKVEAEKEKTQEAVEVFIKEHGQPLLLHEKVRPYAEELRKWKRLKEETAEITREWEAKKKEEQQNLLEIRKCLEATGEFTKGEISADNISDKLSEFQEKVSALQEARREKLEVHGNLRSRLEATLTEVPFQWQQEPEVRQAFLENSRLASEEKLQKYQEELQLDLENLSGERQLLRNRLETSRKAQMEWVQLEQLSGEIVRLKTEAAGLESQKKELPAEKRETADPCEIIWNEG